mmetsp:Transcript_9213/g.30737  ORF Transcript_9213/g.30737 Transcript_9213/m.30737 type:complete len:491 (-) Transcript_9213:1394-2866(-)
MKKLINKLEKVTGVDIDGDGKIAGKHQVHHGHHGHHTGYVQNVHNNTGNIAQHPAAGYAQAPAGTECLPAGWEKKFDPSIRRYFYVNHNNQTTQWEPPAQAQQGYYGQSPANNSCGSCGSVVEANARFCPNCGTAISGLGAQPNAHQLQSLSAQWKPTNFSNFQMYNNNGTVGYSQAVTQPVNTLIHSSGRKKALLIGINYAGTRNALRGCINDVENMQQLLRKEGFRREEMVILTDDGRGDAMPTRNEILRACQWLVAGAGLGDVLFFHFSGHGSQQRDDSGMESDGYNETIVPCDMQQIVDDELWNNLVFPLPSGVRLTAVMDCCHSGTGLDLPFTWKHNRWLEDENPSHSCGDVQLFSGCQDDQTSSDGDVEKFKIGGAMTNAFIRAYNAQPFQTYPEFLSRLKSNLRSAGFGQVPQLSSSQAFDVNEKVFSLVEGIVPNTNVTIGRLQRRKIRPKRQFFGMMDESNVMAAGAMLGGLMLADALFDF